MLLIKNAKVLTMRARSEKYEDLDLLLDQGSIIEMGKIDREDVEILDAKGHLLLPGFIDAHCHLGMFEDSMGFEGSDGNEISAPITPHLRAIDAINPQDRCFRDALSGGVLAVATGPGSANCIGGSFAVIKTWGRRIDDMIIKDPAAMKIAFGENPKRVYGGQDKAPATRMAIAAEIRETLFSAKEYMKKKKGKDAPDFDLKLEALIPVLERKIPLKAHAHRVDDIFTALRIAREFGVKITLDHVTEGHLITEELKQEKVDCIVGPSFGDRPKVELKNKSFETAAALSKVGLRVAIMTDHPVIPIEHLNLCGQYCVKAGMDHYEALKALTLYPARILGVDHRLGSIQVGMDASLVIWDGDPLDVNSNVLYAIGDGKILWKKEA